MQARQSRPSRQQADVAPQIDNAGRTHGKPINDPRVNVQRNTDFSARRARKSTRRRIDEHTLGNHVQRNSQERTKQRHDVAEAIMKRARRRRIFAGVVAVVIVLAAALVMGVLAYRGSVGSALALRDSDATDALKAAAADAPSYTLIAVELGAVAEPLENPGPDMLILARFDPTSQTLALINVPPNLQVSSDNQSTTLSSLAQKSDAKMISALASFTKLDISHFVKLEQADLVSLVDAFDGIEVEIDQVIDDPSAGDVYLPAGTTTLKGSTTLIYLRASNLKQGLQDKLRHQTEFASLLLQEIFGKGVFSAKIDMADDFIQTDCTLAQLEVLSAWFKGKGATDVILASLPGYTSAVAGISNDSQQRFISSYDDFQDLLHEIEAGESPSLSSIDRVDAADPGSFVLEIQNGTVVPGLAAATNEELVAKGFNIGEGGNADVPNYEQTLVVYQGEEGPSRAKSVIEALGIGRPVGSSDYYNFTGDVLLIIGSDYSPVN